MFTVCNIAQTFFITNKMARERDISALSDEEYEILLRKILGRYNTPVIERTMIEKKVLRKYYRLVKGGKELHVGPSGKSIYIDGRLLIRNEEMGKAIKSISKESKNPGIRKLTDRIQSRFVGCSRKKVITEKLQDKSLKVSINKFTFEILQDIFVTCAADRDYAKRHQAKRILA